MKKIIVLILLVALVPAYLFYQKSNKKIEEPAKEMAGEVINKGVPKEVSEKAAKEAAEEANSATALTMYSIADVEKHNTKEDCWLAIEGKVYDVSKFAMGGKHPGGDALLQGCGKDATVLFNTRPMGSGTPHSDKARDGLTNFIIGDLTE